VSTVPKVLITGAGGQVGREATELFTAAGWSVTACDRSRLDVTDRAAVLEAVAGAAPDAVLNLAAWNAVDRAETEVDGAFAANTMAVRHLSEACRRTGARLAHVSTDYVFDGTKDSPYQEWDRTNPRSVYGRSKEAGEREAGPDALVVRTSWVCGAQGSNAVTTVLKLAAEPDRTLAFVTDQRGCPTLARDLAATLLTLVSERHTGLFHVTNDGAVSWYEFVQQILVTAGHPVDRVRPITTAEMHPPRPAPRPANSVLDHTALRLSGLPPMRHFSEPLAEMIDELRRRGTVPLP
jgi:dTDP-4-dehydrorhamnose reductase